MFARLKSLFALRKSTGFLLVRQDDRLLDDIGLTRAQLQAMRLGVLQDLAPGPRDLPPFIRRQAV